MKLDALPQVNRSKNCKSSVKNLRKSPEVLASDCAGLSTRCWIRTFPVHLRIVGVGARLCFGSQPQQLPMAEWVWKGGLDSAIGLLRLVFDTAALRRQQLGYTGTFRKKDRFAGFSDTNSTY